MALETTIGAITFALHSTTRGLLPALRPRPLLISNGVEFAVVEDEGHAFLIVDHRDDESVPARVEFWRPLGAGEVPLTGLLMVADTARPGPAPVFERLRDLALALGS